MINTRAPDGANKTKQQQQKEKKQNQTKNLISEQKIRIFGFSTI